MGWSSWCIGQRPSWFWFEFVDDYIYIYICFTVFHVLDDDTNGCLSSSNGINGINGWWNKILQYWMYLVSNVFIIIINTNGFLDASPGSAEATPPAHSECQRWIHWTIPIINAAQIFGLLYVDFFRVYHVCIHKIICICMYIHIDVDTYGDRDRYTQYTH